eukprot:8627162-Heterocapsa_arctica.AAC.1
MLLALAQAPFGLPAHRVPGKACFRSRPAQRAPGLAACELLRARRLRPAWGRLRGEERHAPAEGRDETDCGLPQDRR